MANVLTATKLVEGSRNLVYQITILADTAAEYSAELVVDVSGLTPAASEVKIHKIRSSLAGFTASLLWDATTAVLAASLADGVTEFNIEGTDAPLKNYSGAGKTGDIKLSTLGLGVGDHGTIYIELIKEP